MPVGENIKRLREARGLTQAQLGEIAGVTDKAVSTWESGKKDPRMGAIQRICDYFKISKSEILLDANEIENIKPKVDKDLDRYLTMLRDRSEMRMLFDVSEDASKEQIEAIVAFIEGLKK